MMLNIKLEMKEKILLKEKYFCVKPSNHGWEYFQTSNRFQKDWYFLISSHWFQVDKKPELNWLEVSERSEYFCSNIESSRLAVTGDHDLSTEIKFNKNTQRSIY